MSEGLKLERFDLMRDKGTGFHKSCICKFFASSLWSREEETSYIHSTIHRNRIGSFTILRLLDRECRLHAILVHPLSEALVSLFLILMIPFPVP